MTRHALRACPEANQEVENGVDLALALRHIWRQKLWLVRVVVLATVAAVLSAYDVSVSPPGLKSRSLESGAAKLGLILDSRESSLAPRDVPVAALAGRAVFYAELLRSQPMRKSIGERTGVPWQTISIDGQTVGQPTIQSDQPGQAQRSVELVQESSSRRLYFTVNPDFPIINLYAQAPTAGEAVRLVQGAADSLTSYTRDLQSKLEVPIPRRAELLQLGDPQGGEVAPGADVGVALIVALAVLLGGCLLILYIPRVVTAVRRADDGESHGLPDDLRKAPSDRPHEAGPHRSTRRVEPSRESGPPR
jgi:hypothetical protein